MEFVFTGSTLLGGYRSILNTDDRVANSTILYTTKVKIEIALEYSQSINYIAVLYNNISKFTKCVCYALT